MLSGASYFTLLYLFYYFRGLQHHARQQQEAQIAYEYINYVHKAVEGQQQACRYTCGGQYHGYALEAQGALLSKAEGGLPEQRHRGRVYAGDYQYREHPARHGAYVSRKYQHGYLGARKLVYVEHYREVYEQHAYIKGDNAASRTGGSAPDAACALADGGKVAGQPYHAYAHVAYGRQHPAAGGPKKLHIGYFGDSPGGSTQVGAAYGDDTHEYDHDYHNRPYAAQYAHQIVQPQHDGCAGQHAHGYGADYAGNAEILLHGCARRRHHDYEAEVNGYRGEIVIRFAELFAAVVYVYVLRLIELLPVSGPDEGHRGEYQKAHAKEYAEQARHAVAGEVLKYLLPRGKAGAHHVSHIRPGDAYEGLDIEFFRAHFRTSFA